MAVLKLTDEMRAAARRLLGKRGGRLAKPDRKALEAIASGPPAR